MIEKRNTTQTILIVLVAVLCFSSCGGGIQNAINPAGPQAANLSRL